MAKKSNDNIPSKTQKIKQQPQKGSKPGSKHRPVIKPGGARGTK